MTAAFEQPAVVSAEHAAALLEPLTKLVLRAGAAIMAIPRDAKVTQKPDGSPVTPADLAADQVIAEGLAQIAPHVPVLSEECCGNGRPTSGSFFVVDPLDGTKEYIAGRNEFTVNLALVCDGVPVLGIIGAPARGLAWRGVVGHGAEQLTVAADGVSFAATAIRTRPLPQRGEPWTATVSRSHLDPATVAFIDARPGAVHATLGSSLKFCWIAEGKADIYPRLAPICEWDIAAGAALVVAAGGKVTDAAGAPLRFDAPRPNFIVPEFIAWGDPDGR